MNTNDFTYWLDGMVYPTVNEGTTNAIKYWDNGFPYQYVSQPVTNTGRSYGFILGF